MDKPLKNAVFIKPFDFYLLRNPIISIEDVIRFNENIVSEALSSALKNVYNDDLLMEAIYLASEELYDLLKKKLNNSASLTDKENEKIQLSLYKYYVRMGARSTPFGLFAGSSLGTIDEETSIELLDKSHIKTYSRLDISCIIAIQSFIQKEHTLLKDLKFRPNTSIFSIHNKFRYVERILKNRGVTYLLNSVDKTEYLEKLLLSAEEGLTIKELSSLLVDEEISEEEAIMFIEELIDNQILTGLVPIITGCDNLTEIIKEIEKNKDNHFLYDRLISIQSLLAEQNHSISKYYDVKNILKEILPEFDPKNLIQKDTSFSANSNSIDKKTIDGIAKDIQDFFLLSQKNENNDIVNFIRKFKDRYDGNEVPLTLALDIESGIGYSSMSEGLVVAPIIEDLPIQNFSQVNQYAVIDNLHELKLKLFLESMQSHLDEVTISEADIAFYGNRNNLEYIPKSLYVLGSLIKNSQRKGNDIIDDELIFLLRACGGPSAVNLITRFASVNEDLLPKLKDCIKSEENNLNAILAGITHLPDGRVGNVLLRPSLRDYEITFLGGSGVAKENQIKVDDLWISIIDDEIVLRSKRLNKRIVPRMDNAHNFKNDKTVIYKFLCDIQYQKIIPSVYWDWGIFNNQNFLPRVKIGNLVVSRRRWILRKDEVANIDLDDRLTMMSKLDLIISGRNIPRLVLLIQGDNELLIDFKSSPAILILLKEVKKFQSVELAEYIETPENCIVKDSHGKSYSNELVIPFQSVILDSLPFSFNNLNQQNHIVKDFNLGSQWAYFKIYCGPSTAENLLSDVIYPLVKKLILNQSIEQFFFIRYKDPHNHLRLRFYNNHEPVFWMTIMQELFDVFDDYIKAGVVHQIQNDVYKREIDRYGILTMELSENLFFYDSLAVLKLISLINNDEEKERHRWRFAILGVDKILNDFNFSLAEKQVLLEGLKKDFYMEFSNDGNRLNRVLNQKYRLNYDEIKRSIDCVNVVPILKEIFEILDERSKLSSGIIKSIKECINLQEDTGLLTRLLKNYVHMFLNRTFVIHARTHELVLYHHLEKFYKSEIARSNS